VRDRAPSRGARHRRDTGRGLVAQERAAAQVVVHRERVGGCAPSRAAGLDTERGRHLRGDRVGEREEVVRRGETPGPELETVTHRAEARRHARPGRRRSDRRLEDHVDVESSTDLERVALRRRSARHRRARTHAQPSSHRERVDQIVPEAVRHQRLFGARAAHRKDRYRLRGLRQRSWSSWRAQRGEGGHRDAAERTRDLVGAGVAILALPLEAAQDELCERARQLGPQSAGVGRGVCEPRCGDRERRGAAERQVASEQLEEHRAEGVDVDTSIQIAPRFDLLRRHVGGRADRDARSHRDARWSERPRDTEVGDDDATRSIDEHVVGLEIAMHDRSLVSCLEPGAHRGGDVDGPRHRQRAALLEHTRERGPIDELHGEEARSLVLADVEDPRDVGVRHLARRLHLAPEQLEHARLPDDLVAEQLQRDELVELPIEGRVDGTHATRTEQRTHLVAIREDGVRALTRRRDAVLVDGAQRRRGLVVRAGRGSDLGRGLGDDECVGHTHVGLLRHRAGRRAYQP
jgi:hypothetical protein